MNSTVPAHSTPSTAKPKTSPSGTLANAAWFAWPAIVHNLARWTVTLGQRDLRMLTIEQFEPEGFQAGNDVRTSGTCAPVGADHFVKECSCLVDRWPNHARRLFAVVRRGISLVLRDRERSAPRQNGRDGELAIRYIAVSSLG